MGYFKEAWNDLFRGKQREIELNDELQFHISMLEQESLRRGMSSEEARRSAILKLGGLEQTKERTREQRFGFWIQNCFKDVVYGSRMLQRAPGMALICLIILALAIGACTVIFSLLNGIVLRPLPYPNSDRLVHVVERNIPKGISSSEVNALNLQDWRNRAHSLDGIAAYFTMGRTLSPDNGESEVVLASQVSADFFRVFQTSPLLGRVFTEEETKRTLYNNAVGLVSPDPLVILSHRLWMRRFASDPQIIGKTIILERRAWKVIGVMPSNFTMPDAGTALWIPWGLSKESSRDQHFANAVGRLAPGVSLSQAEDELNQIADQLAREFPGTNDGWKVGLNPLDEAIAGDFKQILWFLLAAVGLVMLIACVNIAIIQFSRASSRTLESSIRMALGASRTRLVQQFLVECSLLAICGGILGLTLAYFTIHALQQLLPNLPRVTEITMDPTVILISIALIPFTVLLFGLGPAFVATRRPGKLFSGESPRSTSRVSVQRMRSVLVIVEVALSVILISSSVMLIRSFLRLEATDSGFNVRNVLVLPVFLDSEKYYSGSKSRAYYQELLERLQKLPEVVSVGGATALPASPLGPDFERPVWAMGNSDQDKQHADVRIVTTDYFRTLGISVLRGRGFSVHDTPDSLGVVMINEAVASMIWPNTDPVGKQLVVDYSTSGTYPYEVIGVVNDVRFHGPRSIPRPEIYFPHAQKPYLVMNIAIRTKGDPDRLIGPVREVLRTIDPQKPAYNMSKLEDLVGATVVRDRYAMILVSGFAIVALTLASLGIYGVLAFFVRLKVQEIGIRLALGAPQKQITSWIGRQGIHLTAAGVVAGLVAAVGFSHLLGGILFQVSSRDLASLTIAAVAISVTAIIASWIPARRASQISPSIALRYE